MKISKLKKGQFFKSDDIDVNYYSRGESKNGKIFCKCYTKNNERYPYLDRNFPRNKDVILFNPK